MTELEKLAYEARKLYIEKYDCLEYEMAFDDGYQEGFKKAREMAMNLPQHYHGDGGHVGLSDIKELGESEKE